MIEKRRYVRTSTVFPVEIEILPQAGEKGSVFLLQAFTRDVSAGGMCLEVKVFRHEIESQLSVPNPPALALTIDPPHSAYPIKAMAKIAWMKRRDDPAPLRYLIGVNYTAIDERDRARLIGYAHRLKWMPRLAALSGFILISLLAALFVHDQKLISENQSITKRLSSCIEKISDVSAGS